MHKTSGPSRPYEPLPHKPLTGSYYAKKIDTESIKFELFRTLRTVRVRTFKNTRALSPVSDKGFSW